jgi:hypothetical protein
MKTISDNNLALKIYMTYYQPTATNVATVRHANIISYKFTIEKRICVEAGMNITTVTEI